MSSMCKRWARLASAYLAALFPPFSPNPLATLYEACNGCGFAVLVLRSAVPQRSGFAATAFRRRARSNPCFRLRFTRSSPEPTDGECHHANDHNRFDGAFGNEITRRSPQTVRTLLQLSAECARMIKSRSTAARKRAMSVVQILRNRFRRRFDASVRCIRGRTETVTHPFFRKHDGSLVRRRE